jgi:peptide/nickel transport system substrate-binding protein
MGRRGALVAVSLLALTSGLASASPAKQGGIFLVGSPGASVQIDPQLSYVSTGWWLEYATAAKLYNHPDKAGQAGGLLRPEVARGFTVSNAGRTYTFTIKKGFRFSDGRPVTAKNFAYAIKRAQDERLGSPARSFIEGAWSAGTVRGKLVIHLSSPDAELLSKLATPFFQATSTKLPPSSEVTSGYPSAGPYYFAENEVNTLTSLRRNRYYRGARPHHLAGVDVRWNQANKVSPGFDQSPVPASAAQSLGEHFGVNKTRFWVKPLACVGWVAFNDDNGVFAGNPALRKAVNWALDRTAYAEAAGPYAANPWTHLLSPITPGSVTAKNKQPYAVRPNLEKARALAAGHMGDGKLVIAYRLSGSSPAQAQIVRQNLIELGFDPANIRMDPRPGSNVYGPEPPLLYDLAVGVGWCTDIDGYSDLEYVVASAHLSGYEQKLERVERLKGTARLQALGKLDLEITRDAAPVAAMRTYNQLFFFSNRVDPRSLVYQPVYQSFSIPALSLK